MITFSKKGITEQSQLKTLSSYGGLLVKRGPNYPFVSLASLHSDKSLKAWLFRVARNRCVDELRRMRPISFSELTASVDDDEFVPFEFIPDSSPLPDVVAERHDLQQRILRAIRLLPSRLRPVVFLRYTSQKSFSEIGQILNVPEATAKTYFNRAKPFLRAALIHEQAASAC